MADDNSPTGIWDLSAILGANATTSESATDSPPPTTNEQAPPSATERPPTATEPPPPTATEPPPTATEPAPPTAAWTPPPAASDPTIATAPAWTADASPTFSYEPPATTNAPTVAAGPAPTLFPGLPQTAPPISAPTAGPIRLPQQLERPATKVHNVKPVHVGIAAAIVVALLIAIGVASSGGKSPASASAPGSVTNGYVNDNGGIQPTFATTDPSDGTVDSIQPSNGTDPSNTDPSAGTAGAFPGQSASAAPSPSPTEDPQAAALAELQRIRDDDSQYVSFDGQYVAQIASKSVGITDPLQTAANGSHTFYATDILAEHLRLQHGDNLGARVVLVLSADYGKQQLVDGEPLWVTFALSSDFQTAQDVHDWCSERFPTLSPRRLKNQCDVRTLEPIGE